MSFKVLGLSGKAGSGKDYLTTNFLRPAGFYQFSLAWHFKIWLAGQGKWTYDDVFKHKPPEVRADLQAEGTERGRLVYGEDIWCNVTANWMQLLHDTWGIERYVIADIRFPNEVALVQRLGGKVFRLSARERIAASALTAEARLHPSETSLDDYPYFDGFVANDSADEGTEVNQLIALMKRSGWNDVASDMWSRFVAAEHSLPA